MAGSEKHRVDHMESKTCIEHIGYSDLNSQSDSLIPSSWSQCFISSSAKHRSSNSSNTSSVSSELSCARSTILRRHVAFNICSSSNISAFNRARRSEAVSLLLEKTRSHGTDDAWLGRTSRAMRANVGYAVA